MTVNINRSFRSSHHRQRAYRMSKWQHRRLERRLARRRRLRNEAQNEKSSPFRFFRLGLQASEPSEPVEAFVQEPTGEEESMTEVQEEVPVAAEQEKEPAAEVQEEEPAAAEEPVTEAQKEESAAEEKEEAPVAEVQEEPAAEEKEGAPAAEAQEEAPAAVERERASKAFWEAVDPQKRRRMKHIAARIACVAALLALVGGCVYYELPYRCVRESVTIEAGESCPAVDEFLKWKCEEASIVSGISEDMEFSCVQDYDVVLRLYHQNIKTALHVVDTIPPELQMKGKTIMLGEGFQPEDFVEKVSDATACRFSWQEEPDVQRAGTYALGIVATDEGENITVGQGLLTVLEDVTPPVIEGVQEITITVGEGVSYKKNVTVTDDHDDSVQLVIDNSEVDVDTPGDYKVYYRATDKSGNKAEVSTILHVREPVVVDSVVVTEELVNEAADAVLASITDPSMSQYEVIEAIYKWCNRKIAYVDETPKTDWIIGAYNGIVRQRGDCYAYAMAAKCLLTRAGITNMDIERVRVGNGMHFWNLVDIGEGWHHFDTCRRADGSTFFYLTDAELMEYSNAHTARDYPNGTHYYDRSLYPEIP